MTKQTTSTFRRKVKKRNLVLNITINICQLLEVPRKTNTGHYSLPCHHNLEEAARRKKGKMTTWLQRKHRNPVIRQASRPVLGFFNLSSSPWCLYCSCKFTNPSNTCCHGITCNIILHSKLCSCVAPFIIPFIIFSSSCTKC